MVDFKLTQVGRLLYQEHAGAPTRLPIPNEKWNDPTFITRLSFRHTPRVPTKLADLLVDLDRLQDHALFVDTNMTSQPHEWWESLLSVPGRVQLTGRVLRELMPYFARHPDHPFREALARRDPAVVLCPDPDADTGGRAALDYYIYLLSVRRNILAMHVARFEEENGRPPEPAEMEALRMKLQRWAGPRTLRLNTKTISPLETDEALVYHAVAHAIKTGQRTKILSGDLDVEEQFYMMVRLLTKHYFGMLLGQQYGTLGFAKFKPRVVTPSMLAKYAAVNVLEPRNAVVLDLGDRAIQDFIPKYVTFVPVSCITIGPEYTSEVTYGAETAMAAVLDVKAATGGLATDRLGGRDVHPWGVPEDVGALVPHSSALVCFDKTFEVPGGRARVSAIDLSITFWPGDPHVRVEQASQAPTTRPTLTLPPFKAIALSPQRTPRAR